MKEVNVPFRFRLRDMFLLVLVVATLCAWWLDRRLMNSRIALLELRLGRLQGEELVDVVSWPKVTPAPMTPAALVALVANDDDWYELQDVLVPFRTSDGRGEAVDGLLELLDDPDEKVRTRSLSALAQMKVKSEVVVPRLIPLLDDPVTNVQWHAANVLGEFEAEAKVGIPALKRKMMQDDCGIATHAAVIANKLDRSFQIGPRLIELARSPLRENRWRALKHLQSHVDAKTAESILHAAFEAEDDEEIRSIIAGALNQIDAKRGADAK